MCICSATFLFSLCWSNCEIYNLRERQYNYFKWISRLLEYFLCLLHTVVPQPIYKNGEKEIGWIMEGVHEQCISIMPLSYCIQVSVHKRRNWEIDEFLWALEICCRFCFCDLTFFSLFNSISTCIFKHFSSLNGLEMNSAY